MAYLALDDHDYDEAENIFRFVLQGRTATIGETDRLTIESLHAVGWIHYLKNEFRDAKVIEKKVFELARQELGPFDQLTVGAIWTLALITGALAEYEEELSWRQMLLEISTSQNGNQHLEAIQAQCNLALALRHLKRFAEARELDRSALDSAEQIDAKPEILIEIKQALVEDYVGEEDWESAELLLNEIFDEGLRDLDPSSELRQVLKKNERKYRRAMRRGS